MDERDKVLARERKFGFEDSVGFVYAYLLACLIDYEGRVDLTYILEKDFPGLKEELPMDCIELCWQSAKNTWDLDYMEDVIMEKKFETVAEKLMEEWGI